MKLPHPIRQKREMYESKAQDVAICNWSWWGRERRGGQKLVVRRVSTLGKQTRMGI